MLFAVLIDSLLKGIVRLGIDTRPYILPTLVHILQFIKSRDSWSFYIFQGRDCVISNIGG